MISSSSHLVCRPCSPPFFRRSIEKETLPSIALRIAAFALGAFLVGVGVAACVGASIPFYTPSIEIAASLVAFGSVLVGISTCVKYVRRSSLFSAEGSPSHAKKAASSIPTSNLSSTKNSHNHHLASRTPSSNSDGGRALERATSGEDDSYTLTFKGIADSPITATIHSTSFSPYPENYYPTTPLDLRAKSAQEALYDVYTIFCTGHVTSVHLYPAACYHDTENQTIYLDLSPLGLLYQQNVSMQLTKGKDGKTQTTVISTSNQLQLQQASSQRLALEHQNKNDTQALALQENYQQAVQNPFSQASDHYQASQGRSNMLTLMQLAFQEPRSEAISHSAIGSVRSKATPHAEFFIVTKATCMIIVYIDYAALLQQPTTPSLWYGPESRFTSTFDNNTGSIRYTWKRRARSAIHRSFQLNNMEQREGSSSPSEPIIQHDAAQRATFIEIQEIDDEES